MALYIIIAFFLPFSFHHHAILMYILRCGGNGNNAAMNDHKGVCHSYCAKDTIFII